MVRVRPRGVIQHRKNVNPHNSIMTKTVTISVRIDYAVKKALEKAAADDHRPLALYVEKLLIEHLKAIGHLAATDTVTTSRQSQAVTARRAAGAAIDRAQSRDPDTPEDVKAYRKKKLMKIPSKLTKRNS
jgi:hypothetical protein